MVGRSGEQTSFQRRRGEEGGGRGGGGEGRFLAILSRKGVVPNPGGDEVMELVVAAQAEAPGPGWTLLRSPGPINPAT